MTDPAPLIYPAACNALNGESGSGKTWVALHIAVEALDAGAHILVVDLEDTAATCVARLRALGADDTTIRRQVHYIRPTAPMTDEALDYVDTLIRRHDIQLAIIDSIGELMALQGVKPNDDDAVARFYRAIPRHLSNLGCAVIIIDHIPKSSDSPLFAIGSQRKRAAIDGASYMVDVIRPFARGQAGTIKLTVAKDRHGTRATSSVAALVDIAGHDRHVDIDMHAPERLDNGDVRPTRNMGRISDALRASGGQAATTELRRAAGVRAETFGPALEQLAAEGWVRRSDGNGRTVLWRLVEAFDDMIPPPSVRRNDPPAAARQDPSGRSIDVDDDPRSRF